MIVAAVGFVLVIPIAAPAHTWLASALWNAVHAPLFAVTCYIMVRLYEPGGNRAWLKVVIGLGFVAVVTEIAQQFTGREASWSDLMANVFGIVIGLSLRRLTAGGSAGLAGARGTAWCLVLLIAALGAVLPVAFAIGRGIELERRFPVLVDPEMPGVSDMIASMRGHVSVNVRVAETGIVVGLPPEPMPGVVVSRFLPDWRGFTWVVLDVENRGDSELALETHLGDRDSSFGYFDRFNARHRIAAHGRERIRYVLADLAVAPRGRTMDLARMSAIALFRFEGGASEFVIHSISLE